MKIAHYILLSIQCLSLFSCGKPAENKDAETKPDAKNKVNIIKLTPDAVRDINLTISEVKEGELTGEIVAPATLIPNPDLEAYVGTLVEGRVSKVFASIGDHVSKGQILMIIEGMQIGEIKSQYSKSKANLDFAEANYQRLKKLIEQNVGSQKAFLEAKEEFEKAKAEFNADDKRIHTIGLSDIDVESDNENLNHTSGLLSIKSPIDGIIIERSIVLGQLIEPATNAFRIVNTSTLFADGQIYENDLSRIDGKPNITINTTADPNESFPGKITYIGEIVDKETRTIKVRAAISNNSRKLKPEMFAEMRIPIGKAVKSIVIPAEAVVREGDDNYVFVAINDI
jgi:cobalt-zinc-cadmium efflux system membrane fusion protein